jgi:hypothetical protein
MRIKVPVGQEIVIELGDKSFVTITWLQNKYPKVSLAHPSDKKE